MVHLKFKLIHKCHLPGGADSVIFNDYERETSEPSSNNDPVVLENTWISLFSVQLWVKERGRLSLRWHTSVKVRKHSIENEPEEFAPPVELDTTVAIPAVHLVPQRPEWIIWLYGESFTLLHTRTGVDIFAYRPVHTPPLSTCLYFCNEVS